MGTLMKILYGSEKIQSTADNNSSYWLYCSLFEENFIAEQAAVMLVTTIPTSSSELVMI